MALVKCALLIELYLFIFLDATGFIVAEVIWSLNHNSVTVFLRCNDDVLYFHIKKLLYSDQRWLHAGVMTHIPYNWLSKQA